MSIAIATGIISSLGGCVGFLKSSSVPSLIAGNVFGVLFVLGGYMVNNGKHTNGRILILVVSSLLLLAMGRKALTGKFVPVLMTLLSICNLVVYYPQ